MRENLWLLLHNSSLLRKLSGIPFATRPMQAVSNILLPSNNKRRLRVHGGPAKGLVFELNPRWETQLWEGRYEVAVQRLLVERLRPGSVFYDVGAGFGFYSLLAAHLGARVFAFEPDSKNAEALKHHARLNSCDLKIEILNAAVLAVSGHAQLSEASQETGHGSGHVIRSPEAEETTRAVACVSLDEFAKVNALPTLIIIRWMLRVPNRKYFRGLSSCSSDVVQMSSVKFMMRRTHRSFQAGLSENDTQWSI